MSDELDHILSAKDEIVPSSGFVDTVMNAVRNEAAAPPPIPFPWKRALPGMAVAAIALVSLVVAAVEAFSSSSAAVTSASPDFWVSVLSSGKLMDAAWIALASILSFVSIRLSMHFAGRGALKN